MPRAETKTIYTGKPLPDWATFRRTATDAEIAEYRMELHLRDLDWPTYPVIHPNARQARFERCKRNLDSARGSSQ